jgi:hypothetical protein
LLCAEAKDVRLEHGFLKHGFDRFLILLLLIKMHEIRRKSETYILAHLVQFLGFLAQNHFSLIIETLKPCATRAVTRGKAQYVAIYIKSTLI